MSRDKSCDPMYETLDNSKTLMMEYCPAYQPLPPGTTNGPTSGSTNGPTNVVNPMYTTIPHDTPLAPPTDTVFYTLPTEAASPPTDTPPTSLQSPPTKIYINTGDDAKVAYIN